MAEVQMEAVLLQYDDAIQNRQKLFDHNFVEELLNVLSTCMNYQDTGAAQLYKNSNECEYSDEGLEITRDEVAESYMQSEDQTKHYQILLNNNHVKKFLDFAIFLKTRNKSDGKVNAALKSENDNLKSELEALKLHNFTLNSNLKLAHESLDEEKSQRKNLEYLSEKLCSLLLKYQQRMQKLEKIKETTTRASCDDSSSILELDSDLVLRIDTSTSEDSLDETTFSDTDGFNSTPSSSQRTPSLSILGSEICDSEIDQRLHNAPKFYDVNASEDAPYLTILGRKKTNGLEFDMQKIPEPLETNENAVASKNSISQTDKLANSIPPVQPQFTCDICRKSFLKKVGLTCHMRIHIISNRSFHCEKCGKSFMAKRREQKRAKCPNCDVRYNTRSRKNNTKLIGSPLETMKNSEIEDVDYVHKECNDGNSNAYCDICCKSFYGKFQLYRHIRQVHEKKKSYECDTCGKRFADESTLKRHAAVHRSDKPFKCSFCNKCFRHLRNKKRHEKVVHEGYAPFQCAHCDKRCTQKPDLISHIFSQHFPGTRKQFKCDICDKSFAIRLQLKRHKLVHMSQRPFNCSICDHRFKRHGNKLQHEKNAHGKK